ncbi:hypothetical protein A0H81_09021 [Grifola frondosa]|uniref:Uncharacterized protein n=1 Tax=Grifola frondosa TaxID=5627 RepID=A0A1C7M3M4_GRIFR|nr:hypothetical protein A0H81_09021 [Grifola frondosa]
MRKTSYVIAFFAVLGTLLLNVASIRRPDWLIVKNPEIFHSKIPNPSGGRLAYTDYQCRPFPNRTVDGCEKENKTFCMTWSTASYLSELGAGFAIVACLALVFGVTTHSRRRRIWKSVSVLVALHVASQIAAFAVVTDLYRNSRFPTFERARPGLAYVLNAVSWVLGTLVTFGVITTGISASRGHRWAAGNRAYRPIEGPS